MANRKTKDGFTDASGLSFKDTLVAKLGPVADRIRDIHTRFGGRIYTVTIIRVRWTGGRRGIGTEEIVRELCITPTPLVLNIETLQEILSPIGLEEVGSIQVSEISHRFTADDLLSLDADGNELPPDEEVFWEIEFARTDGRPGEKRRFKVRQAPAFKPYRFQWIVTLEKVDENRSRQGMPR